MVVLGTPTFDKLIQCQWSAYLRRHRHGALTQQMCLELASPIALDLSLLYGKLPGSLNVWLAERFIEYRILERHVAYFLTTSQQRAQSNTWGRLYGVPNCSCFDSGNGDCSRARGRCAGLGSSPLNLLLLDNAMIPMLDMRRSMAMMWYHLMVLFDTGPFR
eukprot:scaffold519_cov331-Pavlova_lutheri.AAC.16